MFWSLLQNIGGRGITFIVMIILARLLSPEIFGLIGMLMIFIQVSQTLVIAGFNQALIQKKDTDNEDYSSVFWINLAVSILLYILIFLSAPWIAEFYQQPVLTNLARVLSLVFVINSFSYVQEARLSKDMRFKTLTIIHIPSTLIGGVTSVLMAIMGFGVWSIVALQLVTRLLYAVQIWFYSKWQPLLTYKAYKVKRLFSFGSKLLLTEVIRTIFSNVYIVLIAKYFPVSSVGYYQNASNLTRTPSNAFSSALNRVAFPAFSLIQNDDYRLKQGFKKIIQQVIFWLCPAYILAGVLAEPLFRLVFTEKWLPAVPYFQILCVIGIFFPLNSYNLSIVNVKGRSDLFLKLALIKRAITVLGIISTIPFGIWPLLFFEAASSIFMYFINSYYSGRFINYPVAEQLKDILPTFFMGTVIGIFIFVLDRSIEEWNDIFRILIGVITGIALYWTGAKLWNLNAYVELKTILTEKLKRKKRTTT